MNQLFKDPDPRRTWEGYRSYFYPHEYKPIGSKPLEWLHLHFIGQKGEVEIYLKDYRILTQWGKVPDEKQTRIKKFVKENYNDIMAIIEKQLAEVGIKLDISW